MAAAAAVAVAAVLVASKLVEPRVLPDTAVPPTRDTAPPCKHYPTLQAGTVAVVIENKGVARESAVTSDAWGGLP